MLPLLVLLFAATAFAQTTARIQGTVSDQSGAAVVGAKVTVKNTALGIERTAETNSTGPELVLDCSPGVADAGDVVAVGFHGVALGGGGGPPGGVGDQVG